MPRVAALLGLLLAASSVMLPAGALGLTEAGANTAANTAGLATSLPAATDASEPSLTVAPAGLAPLRPGEDLTVSVTIANPTSAEIGLGTVDIYLAQRALTTRTALEDWLADAESTNRGDLLVSVPTTSAIPAGATVTLPVTVPAASVSLTALNNWGARGIAATLEAGSDLQVEGRGTFVWFLDDEITPVNLSVLMPITVPEGSAGLIPAIALESYTSAAGLLTRQLDGVINRPVAIAIDPMIIASIRILGSSAPASALDWLSRLDLASNDIFPLGYADADPALQSQAGAAAVLAPISFDPSIDPALFTTPTATPTDATEGTEQTDGTDAATAPPADGTTTDTVTPPTSADLLAWDYTRTDIAWPGTGTVARDDLDFFAASGLTTTVLSETNVNRSEIPTPNAVVALPSGTGLVTDDALSDALHTAAMATTDATWSAAMAEVASRLAVVSAEDPSTARTLVASFDRGWPESADRVGQTLEALSGLLWETPATLQAALGAPPAAGVDFDSGAEPDSRLGPVRSLLEREAQLTGFSSVLADPVTVTAPARLELLSLLSTSWADQSVSWQDQITTSLAASAETLQSVTVTTRGPVQVLGSKVPFPITLNNTFDQSVTVRVQVIPSNGRLIVGSDLDTTIDPNSAKAITIPVSAAIGNGDVTLRVTLFTPAGTALGESAPIAVNVRADWEGVGAAIFAGLVVAFFGFGIWRNIVRRRKERAEREADGTADSAELPDPGSDSPPTAPPYPLTVQPHG
ncbi:hypothetical protein E3T55_14575 [Cryobacterium frigoriphilum]|uniref:2-oxoglutarate dehydrogenase n=2 Tax=Cryobacterium frigoriphilum TaxID=1259150 RepID=A0A4R8ZWD7_9MICO|nr:hypothetical protein E3T55_14575 [Cryobacterium frigoriphilum]